jgi:hypothetical protein
MSKSTAGEIWATLSKLNVDEHTEDRNGLSYLSWAWAWGTGSRICHGLGRGAL